ncbi:MAG: EscU/YscU/HrcU family type III secretion system export apparatus switch protein [Acidimicrobiia bacterium]
MADKSSKTEKPTPKRRKDARKEGQIARSQDLYGWLAVMVGSIVVPWLIGWMGTALAGSMGYLHEVMLNPNPAAMNQAAKGIVASVALGVIVYLLFAAALATVTNVAQTGVVLSGKSLKPKWKRVNPAEGFKRMFSARTLWQAANSVLKLALISFIVVPAMLSTARALAGAAQFDLFAGLAYVGERTTTAIRTAAAVGLMIGFVDYGYQRWRTEKDMMMSKQEIKDEMRNSEGDPHVRARQASLRMSASRNRMLAAVADANVVITNPTHVAVALEYKPGFGAPKVLARGTDKLALRIRERARDEEVPIVESAALARALYTSCEVNDEIPRVLFEGVAVILAFVHRLAARQSFSGSHVMDVPISWDPQLSNLESSAGRSMRRQRRKNSRRKAKASVAAADIPND